MKENPWYYKADITESTKLYSLTSANTYTEDMSEDQTEIVDTFKNHLKHGAGDKRIHLLAYFMVSCHYNLEELREVDYIGIYPSSSSTENTDLEYFKETLRLQHKIMFKEPLLIRYQPTSKRHYMSRVERIAKGCDSQFDSIIINPKLKGKLAGKTVCIIDDFTTYGSSCETARHLFEHEDVNSLVFITLGKFSKGYYKYSYMLSGDVYGKYTYMQTNTHSTIIGEFNQGTSAIELVERLGHILT